MACACVSKDVIEKFGYVVDARLKEKIDLAVIAALELVKGGLLE